MRRFRFTKLVRDKIVSGIIQSGNKPVYHQLSSSEYLHELKKKLLEEAQEVPTTSDKEELAEELADVQEVIDHLLNELNLTKTQLKKLQQAKNRSRGSFARRHYVNHVDVQEDSDWIDYYLANPNIYPEIKE